MNEPIDRSWIDVIRDGNGYTIGDRGLNEVSLRNDTLYLDTSRCPADAALRLMAAEASDRLGWEWQLEHYSGVFNLAEWHLACMTCGQVSWTSGAPSESFLSLLEDSEGLSQDEVLAALHGRYLLQAAMKEGT